MALQTFLDSFNITTAAAGNTVVRTGYGFQPKACIYWWSGRTEATDTEGRLTHQQGVGFAVSATDRRCCFGLSQDAVADSVTNKGYRADACIGSITTSATIDGLADLQSFPDFAKYPF